MEYNPRLAALAINFSEIIGEWEVEDEVLFHKILMVALKKSGFGEVSLEEVNRNIKYYLTEATDVDVYALPESEMDMPPIKESELQ